MGRSLAAPETARNRPSRGGTRLSGAETAAWRMLCRMASAPILERIFADAAAFLAAFRDEVARGGLWLPGVQVPPPASALSSCLVRLVVPGQPPIEVEARLGAVSPPHGAGVVFDSPPEVLVALAERLAARAPGPTGEAGADDRAASTAERLRRLSTPEKVKLALVADREERFALLRNPNKLVHLYVLKNPRTGLDEVQYAVKSPTLSPDALVYAAEHRVFGADPQVRVALVRNPRTPSTVALRLLELLPERELRLLAKGNGRPELVQAARRKVLD